MKILMGMPFDRDACRPVMVIVICGSHHASRSLFEIVSETSKGP